MLHSLRQSSDSPTRNFQTILCKSVHSENLHQYNICRTSMRHNHQCLLSKQENIKIWSHIQYLPCNIRWTIWILKACVFAGEINTFAKSKVHYIFRCTEQYDNNLWTIRRYCKLLSVCLKSKIEDFCGSRFFRRPHDNSSPAGCGRGPDIVRHWLRVTVINNK